MVLQLNCARVFGPHPLDPQFGISYLSWSYHQGPIEAYGGPHYKLFVGCNADYTEVNVCELPSLWCWLVATLSTPSGISEDFIGHT